MDLGAYVQIGELEEVAKTNNIEIPRVRGYRLMKYEVPVEQEEIDNMKRDAEIYIVERLCSAKPFWSSNPDYVRWDPYSDFLRNYYLIKSDSKYKDIRWDRIHGWKRRALKFEIKKKFRAIQKQYDTFNKYAGCEDVLYIHSRMGGNNWKAYDKTRELMSHPWFIERVDDYWDSTYCDFYARIKV